MCSVDMSKPGQVNVTVTYNGFTASYLILIKEKTPVSLISVSYTHLSRELRLEVEKLDKEKLEEYRRKQIKGYNYLLEDIKNYNKE